MRSFIVLLVFEKRLRGMIARRRDHFGREPLSLGSGGAAGGRETRAAGRRVRARRQCYWRSWFERRRAFDDAGRRMWRPDVARRRPIGEVWSKKKPAAMFARARQIFDDATMPVICPTSQTLFESLTLLV